MNRLRLRAWASALALCACVEPSYVSLGRNVQPVARGSEPKEDAVPQEEADLFPADVSCATDEAGDLLISGCEPPPPAPTCDFGAAAVEVESECEARSSVECPTAFSTDLAQANGLLSDLLKGCTVSSHELAVRFSDGCATAFELYSSPEPGAEAVSACVAARLSRERYACAQSLACAVGVAHRTLTN